MKIIQSASIFFMLLWAPGLPAPETGEILLSQQQQIAALLQAAEAGDAGAQYLAAFMYAEGLGIDQDPQKAVQWYTQAARQGHPDAPIMLAMMYAEGQGIPQDDARALQWYTVAAEQGQAGARVILSDMYARGQGTQADLVQAYKWALLAEAGGRDISNTRARLTERMTPEQITEAERLARDFTDPQARSIRDPNMPPAAEKVVSETGHFALWFPTPPEKRIIRDDERLMVIHYQAFSKDGRVQYNAAVRHFKKDPITDRSKQKKCIEDYLTTRAFFSWKSKLLRKAEFFQNRPAIRFKHITFAKDRFTIHEGIAFFVGGDFVSLSCVYPSRIIPSPGFQEYLNLFEILKTESAANS